MKKLAWTIYGGLIGLFTLLALGMAISTGNSLVSTLISTVFSVFYLSGLYGYVYRKAILKPSAWRSLFWLNVASHSIRSLLLFFSPTTERVIDVVFGAIFSLPILYALYRYSATNFSVWHENHYAKQKAILSGLLENASEVTTSVVSSTPVGEEKTTVTLHSADGEFIVKIIKELDSETKSFINSFVDLEDVAKFLENNTPIRAGDFKSVYDHGET